jgi:hypothetical protein
MAFFVPVEEVASFVWLGRGHRKANSGDEIRALIKFGPPPGRTTPGLRPDGVRLFDCRQERVLALATQIVEIGRESWRVTFSDLDPDLYSTLDSESVRIVGSLANQSRGFIAIPRSDLRSSKGQTGNSGLHQEFQSTDLEEPGRIIILTNSRGWTFRCQGYNHLDRPLAIYDLKGRLRYLSPEPQRSVGEGLVEYFWDGFDRNGRRVVPGLYFVKIGSKSEYRTAKLFVLR